jgi:hypothetical protein
VYPPPPPPAITNISAVTELVGANVKLPVEVKV